LDDFGCGDLLMFIGDLFKHFEIPYPVLYVFLVLNSNVCVVGCSEMLMACAVQSEAAKTPGKESVAMESFARALQTLPTTIADNAGYDSAQLVSELRAAHSQGFNTIGLGK
jgi:chaperonin GroEL (HSP60 family)